MLMYATPQKKALYYTVGYHSGVGLSSTIFFSILYLFLLKRWMAYPVTLVIAIISAIIVSYVHRIDNEKSTINF